MPSKEKAKAKEVITGGQTQETPKEKEKELKIVFDLNPEMEKEKEKEDAAPQITQHTQLTQTGKDETQKEERERRDAFDLQLHTTTKAKAATMVTVNTAGKLVTTPTSAGTKMP
jgi:hypothetical protein